MGRPTKYNDDMQAKADAYVAGEFRELGDFVPTQEGLSEYLEVTLSTVKLWGSDGKHPAFSATLEKLKAKQARLLISGGLGGEYNSTIAKLMLHNHGYSDKATTDHTSSDGSMTPGPTRIEIVAPDDNGKD